MSVLVLPLGVRFLIEVAVEVHVLFNLDQVEHIFVRDGSEEHAKQEDDRASYSLNLHAFGGEERSHTDLIHYNHYQSRVGNIVDHLAAGLYLPSVIREQVVRVHLVPHLDEHCCSHGNQRNRRRIKDADNEDRHNLSVEVTVQERELFFPAPGCCIVEYLALLVGNVRQEVEVCDVADVQRIDDH